MDNEIKGNGNSYDFGARIQDPRLGRFLSVDPLTNTFASESPYIYGADNPLYFIDYAGKNPIVFYYIYQGVEVAIGLIASYMVAKKIEDIHSTNANRNPAYDWQRSQERAAERFNAARDIAFKNIINNHFNKDPDDPNNWNKDKLGKGALVVVGLALLDNIKSELTRMEELNVNKQKSVQNKIAEIKAKGDNISSSDNKKLNSLNQQAYKLNVDLQAIKDAKQNTEELITAEKQAQNQSKSTVAKPDASYVKPANDPGEIKQ
jgi:RHS repeat-associated protein